jgi:glycosyltransferase involved in cell wall biosynthesis
MSRLAVVVVRFGAGITGGAEAHARMVALRLAAQHEVTILTTCAEDYVTWADAMPPGESHDGPLRVLRFPVAHPRDLATWEAAMQPILAGAWDDDDERRVLDEQGPDVPQLLDHLREHGAGYDAVIFFTLLYTPSVMGIPLAWWKSILVPTLHDEAAAHLHAQGRAIRLARQVLWNSPEERELAERLYDAPDLPGTICGVGVEPPADVQPQRARARYGLERPYLLYAGRIDPDKGCGELVENFIRWHDDRADLVLAGRAWMELPRHPRIRAVGVVDREALWDLCAGATATVVPSRRESLSMLALESLASGTAVLVPSGSPVLEGHVRRSRAGLVYRDAADFAAAATLLLDRPDTAAALGRDGRRYVAANFAWPRVDALYEQAITTVARRARGYAA